MEIFGYIVAILIGISLGMIGSGGSILTVPVLVYLMHIDPLIATTSSLFIVGVTSFTGALRAYGRGYVDFRTVTEFGIPSIFSIFITRHYLLPAIPSYLFSIGPVHVYKGMFLMMALAVLMLIAALSIILSKEIQDKGGPRRRRGRTPLLVCMGLVIGVVTGLLGAGGGFLIIPFLVLFLKLPMKRAVGTSLLIIAINSLFGFLFSLKQFEYNWTILLSFTALAIIGIFIGGRFSDKIPAASLRKIFGWFILVMGIYIIVRETSLI